MARIIYPRRGASGERNAWNRVFTGDISRIRRPPPQDNLAGLKEAAAALQLVQGMGAAGGIPAGIVQALGGFAPDEGGAPAGDPMLRQAAAAQAGIAPPAGAAAPGHAPIDREAMFVDDRGVFGRVEMEPDDGVPYTEEVPYTRLPIGEPERRATENPFAPTGELQLRESVREEGPPRPFGAGPGSTAGVEDPALVAAAGAAAQPQAQAPAAPSGQSREINRIVADAKDVTSGATLQDLVREARDAPDLGGSIMDIFTGGHRRKAQLDVIEAWQKRGSPDPMAGLRAEKMQAQIDRLKREDPLIDLKEKKLRAEGRSAVAKADMAERKAKRSGKPWGGVSKLELKEDLKTANSLVNKGIAEEARLANVRGKASADLRGAKGQVTEAKKGLPALRRAAADPVLGKMPAALSPVANKAQVDARAAQVAGVHSAFKQAKRDAAAAKTKLAALDKEIRQLRGAEAESKKRVKQVDADLKKAKTQTVRATKNKGELIRNWSHKGRYRKSQKKLIGTAAERPETSEELTEAGLEIMKGRESDPKAVEMATAKLTSAVRADSGNWKAQGALFETLMSDGRNERAAKVLKFMAREGPAEVKQWAASQVKRLPTYSK